MCLQRVSKGGGGFGSHPDRRLPQRTWTQSVLRAPGRAAADGRRGLGLIYTTETTLLKPDNPRGGCNWILRQSDYRTSGCRLCRWTAEIMENSNKSCFTKKLLCAT